MWLVIFTECQIWLLGSPEPGCFLFSLKNVGSYFLKMFYINLIILIPAFKMNPLMVRKSFFAVIFQNENYYTPQELYRFCHLELSTSFSLPNIVESPYEEKQYSRKDPWESLHRILDLCRHLIPFSRLLLQISTSLSLLNVSNYILNLVNLLSCIGRFSAATWSTISLQEEIEEKDLLVFFFHWLSPLDGWARAATTGIKNSFRPYSARKTESRYFELAWI